MLEVRLLGQFDVRLDGKPVEISSRAAQTLLAYLMLNPGTEHRREKLAGMFWSDTSDENARRNLRQELWRLRKALEPKTPRKPALNFFLVDDIAIAFNPRSNYWLDAAVLQQTGEKSTDDFLQSTRVYRGELLPGVYDDWAILERERLQSVFEQKMTRLLNHLRDEKRWDEILEWGERWIALGQTPEPAYRALMLAHNAKGDQAKVASTFQRCATALRNDLGVEPSAETRALFEQLSQGKPKTPTPAQGTKPEPVISFARSTNLPLPLTSFIGREKELLDTANLLSINRLLTLTGPGGVGKTRLAIQLANASIEKFKDGVWWQSLATLTDGARVAQAIAQVLDVRESPSQPLIESLKNFLRDKQALLVLDNCEHLIAACAQLAEQLLSACANLKILATSREVLGNIGEVQYQVPTLALPTQSNLTTDALMDYESIRFFVERANTVKPDFVLTERNAKIVLEICRRLDGIPLALELAAARTKILTVEHIAERLNDCFNLLTRTSHTALPHQQTLRATIDWSYDLLPSETRLLFQRLSVFAGGFTLHAAEEICSDASLVRQAVLDQLARLIDRSLVKVVRQGDYERYRMLETIREYACEKLDALGASRQLRERHRDYFIAFAEQAEQKLKSAGQFEWLERLDIEHDNWRAAWDCAIDNDAALALRLASALLDFWSMRGNPGEGREWLGKIIDRTAAWGQSAQRAHALSVAGRLAYLQRDYPPARQFLEQALAIAQSVGDKNEIAFALLWLGWTAHRQRGDQTALALTEKCLRLYLDLENQWGMAMAFYHLGGIAAARGQYAEAEQHYLESLTTFQELGDKFRAGYALNGLGELARMLGDYQRAGKFYQEYIEILREHRSLVALIPPVLNLAWVFLHEGDYSKARALFDESLKLSSEFGNKTVVRDCLAGFASILTMLGQTVRAAQLFGAAEALRENIGMGGRHDPADQKEVDHYVAVVRAKLDPATFAKAWAEGRTMTLEQAITFASEKMPA